jgi:hypothetical protein
MKTLHSVEIQVALNSFSHWMNRPVKRVQVYTWQMACDLFDSAPLRCFRMLPAYRDAAALVVRKELAGIIKRKRAIRAVRLPVYNEARADYI